MEHLRQYIISVTAAAMICAIAMGIHCGKGVSTSLIKLISGIFLAFVVVSPLSGIELDDFLSLPSPYTVDANAAAASGEIMAMDAMAEVIKSKTEAYILDKAAAMDVTLSVDVSLSGEYPPVPAGVRISGKVPPYAKYRLQNILEEDLGISKENQIWTG